MHTYCQICGKRTNYSGRGRPPQYCKSCFRKMREEYFREYWQRNKDRYKGRVRERLGTTDFSPHPVKVNGKIDFERELEEIKREMRRLGLRRKYE